MASSRESGGGSDSSASDEEVPTDRGSFPQPYAFEPARVNYHDDAESSGSESDDGFQGVPESTWKWPIEHQELTGASAATVFPMSSNAEC